MEKIQVALHRFFAPESKFFRPFVTVGVVVAAIASGFNVFEDEIVNAGLVIPDWLSKASEIIGWVSAAVAFVAKLTVDNSKLTPKEKAIINQ